MLLPYFKPSLLAAVVYNVSLSIKVKLDIILLQAINYIKFVLLLKLSALLSQLLLSRQTISKTDTFLDRASAFIVLFFCNFTILTSW